MPLSDRSRTAAGVIAAIAWAAVIGQLAIGFVHAPARGQPYWRVPIDLYGYFTIWSNTLVALVATTAARRHPGQGLLTTPGTRAATVVYILVVGAIYNTLLIGLNPVSGFGWVTDRLLHMVVPAAYPLWWLLAVPRGQIGWGLLLPGLAFPTAYSFVALAKGAITGRYAYFFIDLGKFGVTQVLINIAGLVLLFAALMAMLIAFDRRAARSSGPEPA